MMMALKSPAVPRSDAWKLIVPFSLWFVVYWAARGVLERTDIETWARIAIAVAPIPVFVLFLLSLVRRIRSMDELQRRIQLEALAIAFPLTVLMLMILGLMQRAVTLSFQDWSYAHVAFYPPIFYCFGVIFASRRYR